MFKKIGRPQNPLDKDLATDWQPTGNAKSLQAAKTLGLQPISIPLNHPYQDNKTTDTQVGSEGKNAKLSVPTDEPKTTISYQPMSWETDEDFQDRFLTESVDQLLAGVSVRNHHLYRMNCDEGVTPQRLGSDG